MDFNKTASIPNSKKLIEIYNTLSTIPYTTADNVKKMCGVFMVLEDIIKDLDANESRPRDIQQTDKIVNNTEND